MLRNREPNPADKRTKPERGFSMTDQAETAISSDERIDRLEQCLAHLIAELHRHVGGLTLPHGLTPILSGEEKSAAEE